MAFSSSQRTTQHGEKQEYGAPITPKPFDCIPLVRFEKVPESLGRFLLENRLEQSTYGRPREKRFSGVAATAWKMSGAEGAKNGVETYSLQPTADSCVGFPTAHFWR